MMRILIDTDVILDFMLARQPFDREANEIFLKIQNKEFDAYISAITPVNVFYVARKITDNTTAFSLAGKLLSLVGIARCNADILKNALSIGLVTTKRPSNARQRSRKISMGLSPATRKTLRVRR